MLFLTVNFQNYMLNPVTFGIVFIKRKIIYSILFNLLTYILFLSYTHLDIEDDILKVEGQK